MEQVYPNPWIWSPSDREGALIPALPLEGNLPSDLRTFTPNDTPQAPDHAREYMQYPRTQDYEPSRGEPSMQSAYTGFTWHPGLTAEAGFTPAPLDRPNYTGHPYSDSTYTQVGSIAADQMPTQPDLFRTIFECDPESMPVDVMGSEDPPSMMNQIEDTQRVDAASQEQSTRKRSCSLEEYPPNPSKRTRKIDRPVWLGPGDVEDIFGTGSDTLPAAFTVSHGDVRHEQHDPTPLPPQPDWEGVIGEVEDMGSMNLGRDMGRKAESDTEDQHISSEQNTPLSEINTASVSPPSAQDTVSSTAWPQPAARHQPPPANRASAGPSRIIEEDKHMGEDRLPKSDPAKTRWTIDGSSKWFEEKLLVEYWWAKHRLYCSNSNSTEPCLVSEVEMLHPSQIEAISYFACSTRCYIALEKVDSTRIISRRYRFTNNGTVRGHLVLHGKYVPLGQDLCSRHFNLDQWEGKPISQESVFVPEGRSILAGSQEDRNAEWMVYPEKLTWTRCNKDVEDGEAEVLGA